MKQVYIFNETSRAAVYGVGTYIKQIIESGIEQKGITLNIVIINSEKDKLEIEEIDGIKYYYIPPLLYERHANRYYRNIFFLLKPDLERNDNPKGDKLIFHFNFYTGKPLMEMLKKHYPHSKLIYTIHYIDWCFTIKGNAHQFWNIMQKEKNGLINSTEKSVVESYRTERDVFDLSDKVICLSKHTRNLLANEYNFPSNKIVFIYNGVNDCDHQWDLDRREAIKSKYRISKKENIILFVGRLDEIKGVNIVIHAFREILKTRPKTTLLIVGDGNYSKYMQDAYGIWGKIIFTGRVEKQTLYQFYQIADIGVMMSFHEQCSYVAIEMMMHGIPLIGTTSTGLNEMIEEGVSGLHIPIEEHSDRVEIDTTLLTEKILYLLQNSKERKRMGLNSRKRYEVLYASEIMGEKMLNLYCSI